MNLTNFEHTPETISPETLQDWRRYLYKLKKDKEKLESIKELKAQIIKEYDTSIKELQEKYDNYNAFLKSCLLRSSHTTKTGGYNVYIPDIGSFSCSKENQTVNIVDSIWNNKPDFQKLTTTFSKDTFNNFIKEKCQIIDSKIINTETGEVLDGLEISSSRAWKLNIK